MDKVTSSLCGRMEIVLECIVHGHWIAHINVVYALSTSVKECDDQNIENAI